MTGTSVITDVDVIVDAGAELGEGPVWDARSGRLVWVDILGRKLHQTDIVTGGTDTIELSQHLGAVVPRAGGGFLAALADGFYVVGDGPTRLFAPLPDARPELRFNDGKCDRAGRFWGGTMAYDEAPGAAGFYRLDPSGEVTHQFGDVTISNGLAWTADGESMYYIDTPTRRVDVFDVDAVSGSLSRRRTAFEIPGPGGPDGMTIDTEGGLWIAMWGGSAVHRYLSGRLDCVIRLPVSQPTSCAFGGPDLDELFITSAWKGMTPGVRRQEPTAGALFRARPGVRGLAPTPFAG